MEASTEEIFTVAAAPSFAVAPPFVAAASIGKAVRAKSAATAARTLTGTLGNQKGTVSLSSRAGKTAAKKTLPTAPAASSLAAARAMV